jgi:hypothetical protein
MLVPSKITSTSNFTQRFRPTVVQLNHVGRQTDMASPVCVLFMHMAKARSRSIEWASFNSGAIAKAVISHKAEILVRANGDNMERFTQHKH